MAFGKKSAVTRIAPDEAQGHASAPQQSQQSTGHMFAAGIHMGGVPCPGNVKPGIWGDGHVKPGKGN